MTKTAVEWLINYCERENWSLPSDIEEQAKAMEKHQTLVFGMKCQGDYNKYDFHRNIVDIYNETYGE